MFSIFFFPFCTNISVVILKNTWTTQKVHLYCQNQGPKMPCLFSLLLSVDSKDSLPQPMSLVFWPSGLTNLSINIFVKYLDMMGISISLESLYFLRKVYIFCNLKKGSRCIVCVVKIDRKVISCILSSLWTPKPQLKLTYVSFSGIYSIKMRNLNSSLSCFVCSVLWIIRQQRFD
jgi:hypothetical protein